MIILLFICLRLFYCVYICLSKGILKVRLLSSEGYSFKLLLRSGHLHVLCSGLSLNVLQTSVCVVACGWVVILIIPHGSVNGQVVVIADVIIDLNGVNPQVASFEVELSIRTGTVVVADTTSG